MKKLVYITISICIVSGILIYISILLFGREMIAIFGVSSEYIESAYEMIRIYCIGSPAIGTIFTISGYYQAIGKNTYANIISIGRGFVFQFIFTLALPPFIGTIGVFLSLPLAELITIMIIVGIIIGLITGLVLLFLVNDSPQGIFKDYTPIISILSVIIAYEFSTYLGGSGYMSCFIVGLITGNKQNFKMWLSQKHYDADCSVAETLGTICRMCIFIILGSQVQLDILIKYFIPSLISVLGLIFIVRPICVLLCTLVDRNAKWNKKELLFMMWVRETGVIPAALCGIVTTMKVPGSEIISSVVFMTISITLILQGSTTKLLARKLGLLEVENIEVSQVENIK